MYERTFLYGRIPRIKLSMVNVYKVCCTDLFVVISSRIREIDNKR